MNGEQKWKLKIERNKFMKLLNNKMKFISILLTLMMVVMIAGPTMIVTAVPLVSLGTAANFGVLLSSKIPYFMANKIPYFFS